MYINCIIFIIINYYLLNIHIYICVCIHNIYSKINIYIFYNILSKKIIY